MFKRRSWFVKVFFSTNSILSWKLKYKQPFAITRKDEVTWPVHMLTFIKCPSLPVYWSWHASVKIKRPGGHFGVLTGMRIFLHITVHRTNNSRKPQVKIRFAFLERSSVNSRNLINDLFFPANPNYIVLGQIWQVTNEPFETSSVSKFLFTSVSKWVLGPVSRSSR